MSKALAVLCDSTRQVMKIPKKSMGGDGALLIDEKESNVKRQGKVYSTVVSRAIGLTLNLNAQRHVPIRKDPELLTTPD